MVIVSELAPKFNLEAYLPTKKFGLVSLKDCLLDGWILLYFYSYDDVYEDVSDLISLSDRKCDFDKRKISILCCSVDSKYSHQLWTRLSYKDGGIGHINYPLLSDFNKTISSSYGVLHNDGMAIQSYFLIDPNGIIQLSNINDKLSNNRIDHLLKKIDFIQSRNHPYQSKYNNFQQKNDMIDHSNINKHTNVQHKIYTHDRSNSPHTNFQYKIDTINRSSNPYTNFQDKNDTHNRLNNQYTNFQHKNDTHDPLNNQHTNFQDKNDTLDPSNNHHSNCQCKINLKNDKYKQIRKLLHSPDIKINLIISNSSTTHINT